MKDSEDDSLFPWKAAPGTPEKRGILADSPSEFADSRDISTFQDSIEPWTMIGKGLHVVPESYTSNRQRSCISGSTCRQGNNFQHSVAIYLDFKLAINA